MSTSSSDLFKSQQLRVLPKLQRKTNRANESNKKIWQKPKQVTQKLRLRDN